MASSFSKEAVTAQQNPRFHEKPVGSINVPKRCYFRFNIVIIESADGSWQMGLRIEQNREFGSHVGIRNRRQRFRAELLPTGGGYILEIVHRLEQECG